jgi:CubicO group peptidase (beta-lactamase class C family)
MERKVRPVSSSHTNQRISRRELLCGLGASATVPMLSGRAAADESPLDKGFDELLHKFGFRDEGPGVAVLVRRPGAVLLQRCFGFAHLKDSTPITPRTLFDLASVSKNFTAAAILLLHDRGKLSLLDDVREYIPEFPVFDPAHPIRLTDMLHHVSGVPDYMSLIEVPARNRTYWVNEDYVAEFARLGKRNPPLFPNGQKYSYSNTNYVFLAVVVARVSGKSFGTFLVDEIFKPAGMKHSFVFESPTSVPQKQAEGYVNAIGYKKSEGVWEASWGTPPNRLETRFAVGDGGVWTNLEDMAAWDDAIRSHKLIKPITMHMALVPSETTDGKVNMYGRGWSLYFNYETGKLIGYGHNGLWDGFRTSYYRYLAADRTSIILSNRGDFQPDKFWYPLNDLVGKFDPGRGAKEPAP